MSKGAFQTRLGQLGGIPNFQQTPPMAHSGNYFMPPKPNYLPIEKQAMARVQQPMSYGYWLDVPTRLCISLGS